MKLAIHEIGSAKRRDPRRQAAAGVQDAVAGGAHLRAAEQRLGRTADDDSQRIQPVPHALGQSSGFQSWQYRAIEFLAGNRNEAMLKPHAHLPEVVALLERILAEPSLYDEALRLLARRGFDVGADAERSEWRTQRVPNDAVMAAWKVIYQAPERFWELYELAEKLVDFEDYFRRWRFNHVTTVERIIGLKRGTGGTAGVAYLRKMLEVELFPELWTLRTEL